VVYHSDLGEKPILGVKSIARKDRRFVFSVYSATWYFEIESDSLLGKFKIVKAEKRPIKYIPIVEYPLNAARQGIFEVVLPILDAINKVQSNRIDGIEQFIQSLIVLTNAEIEEEKARWLRDAGLISLKSYGENKAEIRVIAEQLDQQQTQTLIDYLHQTILDIVGMPNRNGGSSTSDTGSAVQMRDGWETAEAMAKSDELMFKRSETEFLKIVLQIMRTTVGTALSLSDVEVKFSRRNYANLLTKAQALQTFMACGLSEEDALSIAGVGTDPIDIANRIKKTVADPKDGVAIA
jgi:SPP1 family phage portal protein